MKKGRPTSTVHRPPSTEAAPSGFLGIEPRWLNTPTALLWIAWSAVVLYVYFSSGQRSPVFSVPMWLRVFPPVWDITAGAALDHALQFLKLAGFVAGCAGIGRAILKQISVVGGPWSVKELNPFETAAFSYGLGTTLAGTLLVVLGLLQLWKTPLILGLSFVTLAAAVYLNRDLFQPALPSSHRPHIPLFSWESAPMIAITALCLFLAGFNALAPEVFYDSLVYHLATPDLYRLSGGLVATRENLYTGFPMHVEMLFAWALFAGDGALAKLVHFSLGLGVCASFLGLALRAGRPRAGWTACALFLATPLVGLSLFKTAVEAGSVFLILLSLHSLLLWSDEAEDSASRRPLFYLSAVFAGAAMAVKYTNWPVLGVLGLILLVLRVPIGSAVAYAATALAFAAPWVAKNLWFYGNPIFPYFSDSKWRSLQTDAWGRNWGELLHAGARPLFEVAAHPWFMSMKGASDADFLGPVFLMGLPALALLKPAGRHGRILLGLLFGLWMLWWPLTAMPRFFMPGLALLALWLAWSLDAFPSAPRRAVSFALFPVLLNGAFWTALSTAQLDAWPVTLAGAEPGTFLNHAHPTYPTPYWSAAQWLNAHSPADARVLVVGDGRAYYLERRFVAASALDDELLPAWVKASADAAALKARFDREGISWLLVNVGELVRLRRDPGFSEKDLAVLDGFLGRYARLRHQDLNQDPRDFRWQAVYELSDAPSGPPDQGSPLLGWYRQIGKAK